MDRVGAQFVGQAGDGDFGHGEETGEAGFDLGGNQAIAADPDDDVDATVDPDVSIFIAPGRIAAGEPALLAAGTS